MPFARNACAIVGIGETDYTRNSGRSEVALAAEASKRAIDDAGLTVADIDGIVHCDSDSVTHQALATTLGIKDLSFWSIAGQGGTAPPAMILHAVGAILSGAATHVLCFRALNGYSETRYGQASKNRSDHVGGRGSYDELFVPYGMVSAAQFYGIVMRRHMLEYGTTKEHFGAIALACRGHANMNPHAQMFDRPMTMEDYLAVRMIAEPLNLFDCCLETDGACAVVVTSAERARDLRRPPVRVAAAAMGSGAQPQGGVWFPAMARSSISEVPAARQVADKLFRTAGLGPADIDVAQLYDCFTITVMLQIEAYGFCGIGEGGPFVEGGRIALGGDLPINTAGGHLSEGYIHGMNHIVEGVRQIRGTSTAQVPDAEVCLVSAAPHPPTSGLILTK